MRVFFATAFFLIVTIGGGAIADPIEESSDNPGLIPGIYCYEYYFFGNNGFDTFLFSGINPNATFMDKDDLLYYEGREPCSIYVMSGQADMNLFGPFIDRNKEVDYSTDKTKILPNPGIAFVDEDNIDFQKFTSGDTVLYGGVLPFVALPDGDLQTEDSFFNEDSFSLFLYFKTKF